MSDMKSSPLSLTIKIRPRLQNLAALGETITVFGAVDSALNPSLNGILAWLELLRTAYLFSQSVLSNICWT
ncbi:MAG: hypothetical protein V1915_00315 [Candidatus Bathyarchaeota archaeon]